MRAALAAIAAGALLSGCVAAVVPVIAGGAIGKKRLAARNAAAVSPPPSARASRVQPPAVTGLTLLPPGSVLPPPSGAAVAAPVAVPTTDPETGWRAMVRYVAQRMSDETETDVDAEACGARGEAVVLDADLAVSAVASRDMAVTALNALRTMGVAVLFTADAAEAGPARATIAQAGLGEVVEGRNLFAASIAARQAMIARDHCVIAIGGARASDFPGTKPGVPWPWGKGWFLIRDAAPPSQEVAARSAAPASTK